MPLRFVTLHDEPVADAYCTDQPATLTALLPRFDELVVPTVSERPEIVNRALFNEFHDDARPSALDLIACAHARECSRRSRRQNFSVTVASIAAPRVSAAARACACTGTGSIAFLIGYGAMHALHAVGIDSRLVTQLSPIPLFAIFLASCPFAALAAVFASLATRRLLDWLPTAFAIVSALFLLEMVFLP